jgi:FkbM family methyltransferase
MSTEGQGTPEARWEPESAGVFALLAAYARSKPHPAKVRLIRAIERRIDRKILRCSEGGGRLQIDGSEYLGWALLTQRTFEPLTISLAMTLMRPGGLFLDIGANRGLFSVAVGAAAGCDVICIEPDAANFLHLLQNLRLNPGLRVTPVNCCVGSRNSLLQLIPGGEGLSAWTKVRTDGRVPFQPYTASLVLGMVLEELRAPGPRLMKIDVEGYEAEVFRGLDWDGPYRPRHVIMECDPGELEKIQFLRDRDYEPRTVAGHPISEVSAFPEGNLHFIDRRSPEHAP